jgi:hypothetical protein
LARLIADPHLEQALASVWQLVLSHFREPASCLAADVFAWYTFDADRVAGKFLAVVDIEKVARHERIPARYPNLQEWWLFPISNRHWPDFQRGLQGMAAIVDVDLPALRQYKEKYQQNHTSPSKQAGQKQDNPFYGHQMRIAFSENHSHRRASGSFSVRQVRKVALTARTPASQYGQDYGRSGKQAAEKPCPPVDGRLAAGTWLLSFCQMRSSAYCSWAGPAVGAGEPGIDRTLGRQRDVTYRW